MDRPRHLDLRGLWRLIGELEAAALTDPHELVSIIRLECGRLIPSDTSLSTEVDVAAGAQTTTATDPAVVAARLRDRELWLDCLRFHPTARFWEQQGTAPALRFSDVLSSRGYRALPLYHYFFRPFGVEYKLDARIRLSPMRWVDIGYTRERRDFSERERELLAMLQPYAQALLRRAETGALANAVRARFGLSRRESELVALLVRGKTNREMAETLLLSPATVRKHLEHVYAKLGVRSRTEAVLRVLRLSRSTTADQEHDLAAVVRSRLLQTGPIAARASLPPPLPTLTLTARERDVLTLLAEGKRNAEIASILSIAPATVKRHLEHIYAKLGVQRRTQATTRLHTLGANESLFGTAMLSASG
jgi:DNA-binding CsgD family transcriptional regulator